MSELGDLLELMHGALGRFETVRLEVREWRHLARAQRAAERWAAGRRAGMISVSLGGSTAEPPPEELDDRLRLWIAPGRARSEEERAWGSKRAESLTIVDGERWWRYDPNMGAMTNDGDSNHQTGVGEPARSLLNPAVLLPWFDLELRGRQAIAARPGVAVRAVPRQIDDEHGVGAWWLPQGADEHLAVVDAERGVLLRVESRIDSHPFALLEVLEISFDEAFPPETFIFAPPPGEEVRRVDEVFARHEATSLHEAARLAPFTVYVPARLPEETPGRMHVLVQPDRERPLMRAGVHISFAHPVHGFSISQSRVADGDHGEIDRWEIRERDGRTYRVQNLGGERQLVVDLDGTRVFMMSSGLDLDTLLEVAASLVPAPTEPPTLVTGPA